MGEDTRKQPLRAVCAELERTIDRVSTEFARVNLDEYQKLRVVLAIANLGSAQSGLEQVAKEVEDEPGA